jgi:hypothetical protein
MLGDVRMSKRDDNKSNIIQFPPDASIDYYERLIDQGNLRVPWSFIEEFVWIGQWLDNPKDRSAGFRALTKAMKWSPNMANHLLDSLEETGYAGFPRWIPIPEKALEAWQAAVKNVLKTPLSERAYFEVFVDRAHQSKTSGMNITKNMITAKYKEIIKRRRAR